MKYIGKIQLEKYQAVTVKKILTDEVIITDNRIQHIINRRGQNFYDEYKEFFSEIIENPDYIFKDERESSAIVSKTFTKKDRTINLVLRLLVEGDNPNYKNSIITAIQENNKRFTQRLRNNVPIYSRFDKKE